MLISTLHVCFGLMSYVGTYVVNMLGPRSRQVGWFIVLSRCIKLGLRGKNTHCLRQHHKRAFASLFGSFQRANTQHNTTQYNKTEWNIFNFDKYKTVFKLFIFCCSAFYVATFNTFTIQLHISYMFTLCMLYVYAVQYRNEGVWGRRLLLLLLIVVNWIDWYFGFSFFLRGFVFLFFSSNKYEFSNKIYVFPQQFVTFNENSYSIELNWYSCEINFPFYFFTII